MLYWLVARMREALRAWRIPDEDTDGQGLVEYALLLVVVAVAMVALVMTLGPGIGNIFSNVINNL